MASKIYLTHCSTQKDNSLRHSGLQVRPEELYTSPRVKRFISTCRSAGVLWAIFSDMYGVWFPDVRHPWYDKSPDSVSPEEFQMLLSDFDHKLAVYDQIRYYRNPARFHHLYRRVITSSDVRDRVVFISHWWEITKAGR